MSKWKVVKDEVRDRFYLEKDGRRFPLPIVRVRKAKKVTETTLELFDHRKKKPDFRLSQVRWYAFGKEEETAPALISALDGKKLKITIEVIE